LLRKGGLRPRASFPRSNSKTKTRKALQRAKFDEFRAVSNKAAETMRAACAIDVPTTMVGRMEAMEKRLEAMLGTVKTVRPAFEAFYATLSDEQKASLNVRSGPRWFWRWRDRW
jgi:hypothetical protein